MRIFKLITVLALAVSCAFAQRPPVADPNPPSDAQKERERQIRMFDQLDKSNPLLDDQKDQGPARGTEPATRSLPAAQPLPGSVAASRQSGPVNPRSQGPQVLSEDGEVLTQEYTGPAVLSRSYTISRPMVSQQVKWTPTLGYTESYDTGLTGAVVTPGGKLANVSSLGYSATWNLSGRHFWKHDQIGMDYSGSQSKIGGYAGSAGTNQSFNADYQHAFSRKLSFNIVTSASVLSQNYGLQDPGLGVGMSLANINLASSPSVQLLDQGTRQLSNQLSLTWRKSARLSFNASSSLFFVQRNGGLFGNTGFQSQGDVNYRLNRKTTVGMYFSHTVYTFTHRVNVSNINTLGGIYSYALGRTAQIRLRAGVTRIENEGLQTVTIDPVIALLLGQSSGIIQAYHLNLTSDISAEVVKDFGRNRSASVSYVRGVSPGNGLLLTSVQEGLAGSFQMKLFRNYSFAASASRNSLSSAAQTVGKYDSQVFGVSLSRPLNHHMTGSFRVDYRTFNITDQPLVHSQFRISTSISWSPGENWIKSW